MDGSEDDLVIEGYAIPMPKKSFSFLKGKVTLKLNKTLQTLNRAVVLIVSILLMLLLLIIISPPKKLFEIR